MSADISSRSQSSKDTVFFCVRLLIIQAVSDKAVDMASFADCVTKKVAKKCATARSSVGVVKHGEAKHACQFYRGKVRGVIVRQSAVLRGSSVLFFSFFKKNPQIHAMLPKWWTSNITPFPTSPKVPQQERLEIRLGLQDYLIVSKRMMNIFLLMGIKGRVCNQQIESSKVALCPLSFFPYIQDMGRDSSEGLKGATRGVGVNGVLYMLCADD
eukprot:1156476-Pelagomonas_calceolata.AAC.1